MRSLRIHYSVSSAPEKLMGGSLEITFDEKRGASLRLYDGNHRERIAIFFSETSWNDLKEEIVSGIGKTIVDRVGASVMSGIKDRLGPLR